MILGVYQRVLKNPDDAEDAFQVTFLVLVRKAASIVTTCCGVIREGVVELRTGVQVAKVGKLAIHPRPLRTVPPGTRASSF
jgi:hypothetical protein